MEREEWEHTKNEASITELQVEMVDRSAVFFPQDLKT